MTLFVYRDTIISQGTANTRQLSGSGAEGDFKMKIASNFEMENKSEMLINRIEKGERVATWSVQTENNSFADDLYNGTKNQCLAYAKKYKKETGGKVQIALMGLTDNLCVDYCYELEEI